MYIIDQEVANQIAKTAKMIYPEMKRLFEMTEEDADKWEQDLRNEIEALADKEVARAVVTYMPLYLENWAITLYIRKTKNQGLRRMMPEILSPREMALHARMDQVTLKQEQIMKIIQVMEEYENRYSEKKKKQVSKVPAKAIDDKQAPIVQSTKPSESGKRNPMFSDEAAAAAKERLRKKYGNLNTAIDPDGIKPS